MSDATRRTLRTALALVLAIATSLPVLLTQAGIDPGQLPWLTTVVAVAIVITRAMQTPGADRVLGKVRLGKHVREDHPVLQVDLSGKQRG